MENSEHFDVIIIGGGPIGIACALEARQRNINALVIEKGTLVNSIYNYPVNMSFFSTSERLEIGNVPFVSNNPKPNRNEALEYYRRVAKDKHVPIKLFERVLDVKNHHSTEKKGKDSRSTLFTIITSRSEYTASFIVFATGFYDIPYLLNVKGEQLNKVNHYYRDPHFYAFQKLIVVGAQNSAVDAALETWRKGAEVTMVVRGPEIGKRVKYWVRPDIDNRISEGSIKAYFNSSIIEIRPAEVDVLTPGGLITIQNDWVLSLTGYQPDLGFIERTGIKLSMDGVRKPEYDEETHESNVQNIYLAGVICGGMNTHRLFIENSRDHAQNIMKDIAKKIL